MVATVAPPATRRRKATSARAERWWRLGADLSGRKERAHETHRQPHSARFGVQHRLDDLLRVGADQDDRGDASAEGCSASAHRPVGDQSDDKKVR
jgi:hypothetical protein